MARLRIITITVDEDVARWARIEAAKEDTSVSRLVGEMLRERMAEAWKPVAVAIPELSWKLQHRYQLSFWDALIVSAAKATGSGYLLTEDLQAGQELQGVKVLNPFLTEPASLGGW
jgi:predicted nucleic acid-binding protein